MLSGRWRLRRGRPLLLGGQSFCRSPPDLDERLLKCSLGYWQTDMRHRFWFCACCPCLRGPRHPQDLAPEYVQHDLVLLGTHMFIQAEMTQIILAVLTTVCCQCGACCNRVLIERTLRKRENIIAVRSLNISKSAFDPPPPKRSAAQRNATHWQRANEYLYHSLLRLARNQRLIHNLSLVSIVKREGRIAANPLPLWYWALSSFKSHSSKHQR